MSLISDALKKAQRQRTLESAEPGSGGGGRRHAGGGWSSPQKLALAAAGLVAVIAVAVAVTITFLQPDADEIAAAIKAARTPSAPPSENVSDTPPSIIKLPPLPRSDAADAVGTVQSAPAGNAPTVAPVAATPPASTPAPAAAQTAAATAPSPEPVEVRPTPAPSVVIQQFVDDMEIRAVSLRSIPSENRVMIGSRVYGINEVVDRALGLKLVDISDSSLTFADPGGTLYRRSH